MRKVMMVAVAMIACLAMVVPSQAFTTIAQCSGSASPTSTMVGGCNTTFVATLNLDTVHVRVQPGFTFFGSDVETQIFEVGNVSNEVHYFSTWATGRIELDGPLYSGPYQLLAGHTYTLVVATPPQMASGSLKAFVEV